MSTVPQAFDNFMRGLELTPPEQEKVSQQQNELRDRIRKELGGVVRDVIVGSYARKTAIRPLNDVDLFLELDPQVHGARHSREPQLLLEDVQRALRRCYPSPGPETRIQGRSVNIEFSRTKIGYDVIPAFRVHASGSGIAEVYDIPNRSRQNWIKTNPEVHKQRCIAANTNAGGMLNRLIKAAKHWNRGHRYKNGDKPLRSFHLEVMAYGAFTAKPADERRGLRDLFVSLESGINSRCPDPAGLGPDIDKDLSSVERQQARQMLQTAAQTARAAVQREEQGHYQEAWKLWRSLLGPEFPAPTQ
jgi:predicted nucleotidyltransferase